MTKLAWVVVIGTWLIPPGLLILKLWLDYRRHKKWSNDRVAQILKSGGARQ